MIRIFHTGIQLLKYIETESNRFWQNLAHELPEKHQDLITYGEFLEGIARVATLKWEDTSIPLYDKVKWSVEFVGELNNDIELCP